MESERALIMAVKTFVALNGEGTARFYGLGTTGVGHAILIPSGTHNDPLSSGDVESACTGKALDSGRLSERFQGDAMCKRCVKWLATDGGQNDVEAAREDKWREENEGPSLAEVMGDHTLITLDGVREVKADADASETPEPVRPLTREDVRAAVEASREGAATRKREAATAKREAAKSKRAAAVAAERERLTAHRQAQAERKAGESKPRKAATRAPKGTDKREASAPASKPAAVDAVPEGSEGGEALRRREAVQAYYAAGHPVPTEVATLPDPTVSGAAWRGHTGGSEESTGWCDYKGAPVDGSDADGIQGQCPGCCGIVSLSDKGEITKHRWYGVTVSPGSGANRVRLSSASLPTVEHGSVPGSPVDADKRRAAESRCDRSGRVVRNSQGGTKKCTGCARPVVLVKGERTVKGKRVSVWEYPTHVFGDSETATKEEPRHSFRPGTGSAGYVKGERRVTPRGTGADAGKGARDHGGVDGSANTGRVNLPPVQPKRGWLAVSGTGSLAATVRPGVDSSVTGEICPVCQARVDVAHKGMGRAARRRHSQRVAAWHREQKAVREARAAREIERGERLPAGARKAARKAASIGSFSEGTLATTGTVVHDGKRPEVPSRVKPRGKTREAAK